MRITESNRAVISSVVSVKRLVKQSSHTVKFKLPQSAAYLSVT